MFKLKYQWLKYVLRIKHFFKNLFLGGGGGYGVCHIIFPLFSKFHIQKCVQGIIGLKLKNRIMYRVKPNYLSDLYPPWLK